MSELPVSSHVDDVHAHPHHTGNRWLDIMLAITAIFISVVSLYVAVQHGHTERDLVASNSWPFPQVSETDNLDNKDSVAFGIVNAGTGPAKIYSVQVSYAGHPVETPVDLLHRCCGAPTNKDDWRRIFHKDAVSTSTVDSTVLRPGARSDMMIMTRDRDNEAIAKRFSASLVHLGFEICYCSVLDECWISRMRSLNVERVQACSPPAHPYRVGIGDYPG